MPRGTFQDCRCQCPIPGVSPCWSSLHRRPSNTRRCFDSVSCGIIAPFLWVLVHTRFFFVPFPRLESMFSQVLGKSHNQIPLTLRVRVPGDSQSLCQIRRLGSLIWGSEPSQQWENFFGITVLQFVGHAPGSYGIWSYPDCTPPTISTVASSLSLDVGYLFLVGSSALLSVVVQQVCDCDALTWGESTRPSTPPSWTRSPSMLVWFELKEAQEPEVWFHLIYSILRSTNVTSRKLLNFMDLRFLIYEENYQNTYFGWLLWELSKTLYSFIP